MDNITPFTCFNCNSKFCKATNDGTFDICKYGIAFINENGKLRMREPKVPINTIAKNLRHEINPILHTIIQQATNLDQTLSAKKLI